MKYVTNDQTLRQWNEDFKDIDNAILSVEEDTFAIAIILIFRGITVFSKRDSERDLKVKHGVYNKLCDDFGLFSSEKRGDMALFIRFVLKMIEKDWITKDEAIDILKDFPDTDVLVEIIRYDKPLCVNRWEI